MNSAILVRALGLLLATVAGCGGAAGGSDAAAPSSDGSSGGDSGAEDGDTPVPPVPILHRTVDLTVGEQQAVTLGDGQMVTVKLIELSPPERGPVAMAVRRASAHVAIGATELVLPVGGYHRPVTVGAVQIDCPVTRDYYANTGADLWALQKDARLRLWPAGSGLLPPGTLLYPVRSRWNAGDVQADNEPILAPYQASDEKVYYHAYVDLGGLDALEPVLSASDGVVVASGIDYLAADPLVKENRALLSLSDDIVTIRDDRGWYHQYWHLDSRNPALHKGDRVTAGQTIGIMGKKGASGGWSHVNYDIIARQPSGKWGIELAYAFLWEAYVREHSPPVTAVAGPWHHETVPLGTTLTFDAAGSVGLGADIGKYEWAFTDGATAAGPTVTKTYDKPGSHSEILKVTDAQNNIDFDFIHVHVFDPAVRRAAPRLNLAFGPSLAVKPGDPITFKVRTFFDTDPVVDADETWDFGDGSAPVTTRSKPNQAGRYLPDGYAQVIHPYAAAGHYLVRVERTADGLKGVGRLHVVVGN